MTATTKPVTGFYLNTAAFDQACTAKGVDSSIRARARFVGICDETLRKLLRGQPFRGSMATMDKFVIALGHREFFYGDYRQPRILTVR